MTNSKFHNQTVNEFLRRSKEMDRKRYDEICKKYPTLTPERWHSIRQHEFPYSDAERDTLYGTNEYEDN
jgi:hypothetical protein